MRILFVAPQLPYPPQKGTTTRNFNIVKNLARNHEIHLICFGDPDDRQGIAAMSDICEGVKVYPACARGTIHRAKDLLMNPYPDLALRLSSAALARGLREKLAEQRFDVVQIEGLEMTLHWRRSATASARAVVFDEHNAEYLLQRRAFEIDRRQPAKWARALYSLVQWQKLARYESGICRSADGVVAVSENDAEALRAITPLPPIAIVPNGVDLDYFTMTGDGAGDVPTLLFTGTMDFRPNVDAVTWFCAEILPLIRREVPQTRLMIVGREPLPAVVALQQVPGVIVTGLVPDVRDYFRQATVYVVPMRFGGGTRFKVLEAMAAGIPVVSTSLGAEGIEANTSNRHGQHLIIADEPKDFAGWVIRLLRDAELRRSLALSARTMVERNYDWRTIVPRLEEFYNAIVA